MRRRYTDSDYEGVHINVIPLIDVMFFLVLFFVATSSFIRETGVDVNRPTARSAVAQDKANIIVSLTKHGEIWIDRRKVDIRALRANVERMHAENPGSSVIIAADAETQTQLLVAALDEARLAGVRERGDRHLRGMRCESRERTGRAQNRSVYGNTWDPSREREIRRYTRRTLIGIAGTGRCAEVRPRPCASCFCWPGPSQST